LLFRFSLCRFINAKTKLVSCLLYVACQPDLSKILEFFLLPDFKRTTSLPCAITCVRGVGDLI
jgi:hypothetical protein